MSRHPNTHLIAAVIGALLLSVFLCLTPGGEAGRTTVERETVTTTALGPHADRAETRSPRHGHHGHGANCSSAGVVPETLAATRHVPDAIALASSLGDTPTASATELRAPPYAPASVAGSGRSTQIRVCRWRI
ncbi:hypothetical protein RI138_26510 [Streptomyces sp. C11-1]|uniref:Secreted protein n=1 Tax=Streptomyces durocortorensis TaxID=2811104 RepID=A0ABY9W4X8_9ACTN|nr:hypothetical protein [Streptomyces durocortorensis]WNF30096.1 hypothetical protein RI138_26510 [Streptomyces durocortorensis]